ncbi:MAG: hypothetical protein KDA42_17645 [Planctomycetales bacterium]|nr:hypothetical protein [Planctomycetales bacterium]
MLRLFYPDERISKFEGASALGIHWEAADILAFSGNSAVSLGIKIGSCSSVSHVGAIGWTPRRQLRQLADGGVLRTENANFYGWIDRHLLYESTTLANVPCAVTGKQIEGVQAHDPDARIRDYNGQVWLYRLLPAWRRDFDESKCTRLTGHLLSRIGQQYDGRGAILSGTRIVKHFWAWRRVDRSSLFCSEYLASVLQHVGLFPISNASKITPGGLIETLIDAEIYAPGILVKG